MSTLIKTLVKQAHLAQPQHRVDVGVVLFDLFAEPHGLVVFLRVDVLGPATLEMVHALADVLGPQRIDLIRIQSSLFFNLRQPDPSLGYSV